MNAMQHQACFFGEPCVEGKPAECPPAIAAARRDRGRPWSALEVREESGGLRHFLGGEPVHCGDGLRLQAVAYTSDDYGEYTRFLQEGRPVRYEARFLNGELRATLHTMVDGHEFIAAVESWMRFRVRP